MNEAHRLFDRMYEKIGKNAQKTALGKTGRHGIDPKQAVEQSGQNFIQSVSSRHNAISELDADPNAIPKQLQKLKDAMDQATRSKPSSARSQRAQRIHQTLQQHVAQAVQSGQVEPLTAKAFLRYLPHLRDIDAAAVPYNVITRHEKTDVNAMRQNNPKWAAYAAAMFNNHPIQSRQEQESAPFYHFNPEQSGPCQLRIYLSPRPDAEPHRVLEAWQTALQETGLEHRVYHKVASGLSTADHQIVVYPDASLTDRQIGNLLTSFRDNCPDHLLQPMTAAVRLAPGISLAGEPESLNHALDALGEKKRVPQPTHGRPRLPGLLFGPLRTPPRRPSNPHAEPIKAHGEKILHTTRPPCGIQP